MITISFIWVGHKTSKYLGNRFDSRYFFQRVSMLILRYNSILFHETFPTEAEINMQPFRHSF